MEDYLKHIEIFHKDYLYSQTNKEKYIKCKQCENHKRFIINDNELIYNCGEVSTGPCGDQFKISIPDYIHYEKIMKAFQQTINGSFNYNPDIHDYSEYDLMILSKHLSLKDELEEYNEIKETILKDSEKLTSFFVSSNKLKEYYDKLSTLNQDYQKNMIKKKKILYDLENDPTITLEDKIRLRKEYAKIIKNELNEKYPIYESFIDSEMNHYLLLNPEEKYVHKYQTRYLDTAIPKKVKKLPKKKEKVDEYFFDDDNKGYKMCKQLSEKKLSQTEINKNRKQIYDEITETVNDEITENNFKDLLKSKEIKLLFDLYDQYFFNNKLSELAKELECQWIICWNDRCTKTAGRQRCKKDGSCKIIEIELSSKVFSSVIKKMKKDNSSSINMDDKNKCDSILSCLQLVFEHELIHGLQNCFCENWMYQKGPGIWSGTTGGGGHSKTFMSIMNNLFGHVDYRHKLFTPGDEAIKVKIKEIKEKDEGKDEGKDELEDEEKEETNLKKKLGDELEDLEVEMAKEISKKQKEISDKKQIKYFSRSKDNKWLSAFNKAESFEYDGYTYPTVEHAFHAQKIDPKDPKEKEYKEYLSNPELKPNEAKKYGGKTSFKKNNFIFRKDWDKNKLNLMEEITETYYSANPDMKQKLIETNDAELLHSGPLIDSFWGVKSNGTGGNHHGKILMKLRKQFS